MYTAHILYKQKLLFWMRLIAINHCPALETMHCNPLKRADTSWIFLTFLSKTGASISLLCRYEMFSCVRGSQRVWELKMPRSLLLLYKLMTHIELHNTFLLSGWKAHSSPSSSDSLSLSLLLPSAVSLIEGEENITSRRDESLVLRPARGRLTLDFLHYLCFVQRSEITGNMATVSDSAASFWCEGKYLKQ